MYPKICFRSRNLSLQVHVNLLVFAQDKREKCLFSFLSSHSSLLPSSDSEGLHTETADTAKATATAQLHAAEMSDFDRLNKRETQLQFNRRREGKGSV
ncbi:unnamed protein product [Prunus armeniaca]|uniref:Uncharacterized protein n=1 Tax=Prunus armeniaca TaxID=36596 RepID=A0A6J5TPE5_PRUAR|nr:hypothetical protein GBA52_002151 [Prunus armeniaca]CAB4265499.1 unnamed protein product [Prunus armeniaca]